VFPKKSSPIRGWFPVVEIGISCQVRAADLKGGGLRYARLLEREFRSSLSLLAFLLYQELANFF
jgi:hypothetical protein